MTTQELIPFWSIVEQLRQFCAQRRTGTAFIVSDDNRMAQVHLESGNIVSLLCRNRRGMEALTAMRTMLHARLRFDDNYIAAPDSETFCTADVIDLLASNGKGGATLKAVPVPAAAAAPARSLPAVAIAGDNVARLERLLIQYIGPMGQLICADHVEGATDLRALAQALADEIPDKKQAAEFRLKAASELGIASL